MAEEFGTEGMLDMYLFENGQLLEQVEAITLERKDADCFGESDINEFFRAMHTIKGSSGIMMYDGITKVAHKLEDVFYYLRESKPDNVPHMELVEHIFSVCDFIAAEFDKIRDGGEPDGDSAELVAEIDTFLEKIKNNIVDSGADIPEENVYVAPSQFYIAPVTSSGSHYYRIHMFYKTDTMMANLRAYQAVYSLGDVAEDLQYVPENIASDEKSADIILSDGFKMLIQTQSSMEEVKKLIDNSSEITKIDIDEVTIDEFMGGLEPPQSSIIDLDSDVETIRKREAEKEAKKNEAVPGDYVIQTKQAGKAKVLAKQSEKKEKQQSFITVSVDKMDALMDLIGEIVIAESVVLQNPDLQVPGLNLTNFNKAARQLNKFTSELQDVIMSMRMMPLANTFQKMNRIVFDTSRKLGKDIELEIIGEGTEVDKSIIEHISDPLMHLVRNSVDHGIEETADERVDAGKNAKGKITLEAKNEGGKVFIIVKDDGKGMDPRKIFNKARENGLISDKMVMSDFTNKEIFQFITYPGFSTKEAVTELSGRGVGMDVVMKNIQQIGGRLDIDSVEGVGSTFTMKIPLTLAIIEGIVFGVGKSTFVVESNGVKEFFSAEETQVVTEPNGEEYVVIRDEYFPVVRLEELYNMEVQDFDKSQGIIMIFEHEGQKICIWADHLLGQQEIVVKPIPTYIKKVDGISGCTQLGDGSLALILDVGGLIQAERG